MPVEARLATVEELAAVHDARHVAAIEAFGAAGGGHLDADTAASAGSWDAARLAAGAGLEAVDRLEPARPTPRSARCARRGTTPRPSRAMGFCLFNNVAVTASALAARGERVLVVDYDAHHGNGTQDVFWDDPRVAYVSLHQWPLYPGTGALDEVGGAGARWAPRSTCPLPAGATGDGYLAAVDDVVEPLAATFAPTWLLLSAGFDAHRADPLTGLGLSAGDYADLTARLAALVAPGHRIAFLEGGYDLDALGASAAACVAALAGERLVPEAPTSGGPGREVVAAARLLHDRTART